MIGLRPIDFIRQRRLGAGFPGGPLLMVAVLCLHFVVHAEDWSGWRGPTQDGASAERGLVSSWTPGGAGQIWHAEATVRSTPVIINGRVYVIGRTGEGITEQEVVVCLDAGSGELVWEDRFNVYHTTIPFNRVGWASLAADPETGNIYAHGVQGVFTCYTGDGDIVWQHSLTEEFRRISGYGGRTHTPFVDGDLVIVSYLNGSWGSQAIPRHRYFAFDKRTGEVVWTSTPGGKPLDTTYSVPVAADIGGQRLLIAGNADGGIYAMKMNTGEKVWGFQLSKRGINGSVVVEGDRVYAAHGEENHDNTAMGRLVCIDGTGTGDVTKTHEVWRYDEQLFAYTSPVVHGGRIYMVDNSAKLHSLDAATGEVHWVQSMGTVGKGSPVWADGKIYATSVNGGFIILKPGVTSCEVLDKDKITMADGGHAEIYGSPAVAYGRVYLAAESGVYCLGDPEAAFEVGPGTGAVAISAAASGSPAHIQVVPAEVLMAPGEKQELEVRVFDDRGRLLGVVGDGGGHGIEAADLGWSTAGLEGSVGEGTGELRIGEGAPDQVGTLTAVVSGPSGELRSTVRVRVLGRKSWTEDFEGMSTEKGKDRAPAHWIGAGGKFFVREVEGSKVLMKTEAPRGLQRSNVYIGPSDLSGYTVQADLMGAKRKRNRPDMGLIAQRYTLDIQGNHQRLQIRTWAAALRMAKTVDFSWEMDEWYTAKMRVDVEGGKAIVRGKVWKRGEAEPAAWTITAEDPLPNVEGSPGIYGYSAGDIYYDNISVTMD